MSLINIIEGLEDSLFEMRRKEQYERDAIAISQKFGDKVATVANNAPRTSQVHVVAKTDDQAMLTKIRSHLKALGAKNGYLLRLDKEATVKSLSGLAFPANRFEQGRFKSDFKALTQGLSDSAKLHLFRLETRAD